MQRLLTAILAGTMAFGLQAPLGEARDGQDTTDKHLLKYKFKEGDKVNLDLYYNMSVKLDEVPEIFAGAIAEDVLDVKMKGRVSATVTGLAEDGTATLKGRWLTLKAKGHAMVSDVNMDYDAERDAGKKEEAAPADDFGGLPGMDLEASLKKMVKEELVLKVSPTGAVSTPATAGVAGRALSLNGLMGPFPARKVGKGDTWKGKTDFKFPGMGIPVSFTIESTNTYGGQEKVGDLDCVVIASKLAVKGADSEAAAALGMKIEVKGEGTGSMHFSAGRGRPAKASSAIKVRVIAGGEDPTSGEELSIKATLKIAQGYTVVK